MGRVKITDDPLVPQTIGKVKRRNFGILTVFAVLIIFGIVVFLLPDIKVMIDEYMKNGTVNLNHVTNRIENLTNEIINKVTNTNETKRTYNYHVLGTEREVKYPDIEFNGINAINNTISVTIDNKSEQEIYMHKMHYFLEIYNENKEIIKTYFFSQNVKTSRTVTFNNLPEGAAYFDVVKFENKDYPYFLLEIDEKTNQTSLLCSNDGATNKIRYTFLNEILYEIMDQTIIKRISDDEKEFYTNLKSNYDNISGLRVTISDGNPYEFTIDVNPGFLNSYIKEYYFDKTADAREVKFKMERMGYSCK